MTYRTELSLNRDDARLFELERTVVRAVELLGDGSSRRLAFTSPTYDGGPWRAVIGHHESIECPTRAEALQALALRLREDLETHLAKVRSTSETLSMQLGWFPR